MVSSRDIDPAVLQALEEHGFRPQPGDQLELMYIDEHGHMFSRRQLMNETAESVIDLIRHLHHDHHDED
jgi:hypothetical protein